MSAEYFTIPGVTDVQPYWTIDVVHGDCMIVSHGGFCRQHSSFVDEKYPTRRMADSRLWELSREYPYIQFVVTKHE